VFQPDTSAASHRVGASVAARSDQVLDCAAFLVDPGVPSVAEILGIGRITVPGAAAVGMRVIKSGRSTGVTEGEVEATNGPFVSIEVLSAFPLAYDLSEPGDSGSVWCDAATRAPVALHRSGTTGGLSVATAVDIGAVLLTLGLSPIP
jgi:endonuclease G